MRGVFLAALLLAAFPAVAQPVPPARFTTGCEARAKDQFGDKQRQYCFLMVHNSGMPQYNPDYSWRLNGHVLVEIDAKGEFIVRPKRTKHCPTGPKRIAVDQQRIDSLGRKAQIAALEKGSFFTIEQQHHTNCNIAPYGTRLTGGVLNRTPERRFTWNTSGTIRPLRR